MAKRGPKVKKTRTKWDKEPKLSLVDSKPHTFKHPSWLTNPHAVNQFYILAERLDMIGKRTIDSETLALACAAFGRAVVAEIELEKHGLTVKGAKGTLVKNPAAQIMKESNKAYWDAYEELGISKARIVKDKK